MTSWSRLPSGFRVGTRQCRSALNKTQIPGADFCVNPYFGCSHGCLYCYASFMLKHFRITEPWGSFVEAKVNLPTVLQKEHKRLGRVLLGTVCDPYQPVEADFQLSREVLRILGQAGFEVEVLTKSDLVLRDLDLLMRYPSFSVELTITTLEEEVREFFEPGAAPIARRFEAAERLVKSGVETTVFFGPVLPYFSDSEEKIGAILEAVAQTGVKWVLIDRLNYLKKKLPLFRLRLRQKFPLALTAFERALKVPEVYAAELRAKAISALNRVGLDGRVVF
ncbi:MAG: radical SAM protein [candidate division WOR-3 bacterium]